MADLYRNGMTGPTDVKPMEDLTLTKNVHFMKRSRTLWNSSMESLDDAFQTMEETRLDIIAEMEDWINNLQESINMNMRNQNALLKNLETHVEQLAKDYQAKAANEEPNSLIGQCKVIFANDEAPKDETSSNGTNKLHGVPFIFDDNM
uniref:Uncharacterized protein n=1 Tax=Tanacetum cinerariifolium TaxID=118510 RepID=A0A6L2JUM5_TANCI|nr:hypothetical protein [Tanacetum cinerariifolium]